MKKITLGPDGIANYAEHAIGYTPENNKDDSAAFLKDKKCRSLRTSESSTKWNQVSSSLLQNSI